MLKMSPYAILLGGKHPQALLELHDLRFTLASSSDEAFRNVASLWFGDLASSHVDAWVNLSSVDGYSACKKQDTESGKILCFVNVGSYLPGVFAENHHYFFLIASSLAEVKKRALLLLGKPDSLAHIDNAESIDAIIQVDEIDSQKLYWKKEDTEKSLEIHTGYWPLKKYR